MHRHHDDIFDRGLQFDLSTLLRRRHVLGLLAGAGVAALAGCAGDSEDTTAAVSESTTTSEPTTTSESTSSTDSCTEIPEETAGPYPGDGSNGANILTESGVVRSDIRKSIGSASGVAAGVPLTINLTIQDTSASCAALAGAAVYLWHCDRDGNYSMYSESIADENYLRGVQETDATGKVTFTSIFPACYSGRWPHIHFEVYPSVAKAADSGNKIATSQLALPADVCDTVYATDGYSRSVSNLKQVSLDSDNVFGDDDGARQVGAVVGTVASGLTVTLTVPV